MSIFNDTINAAGMKEDIYLTMLRFGKAKLDDSFTVQNLVDYLNQCGHKDISIHSAILHQYFFKIFFAKDNVENYPPNHSGRFYLRPECYMQLLEYDAMVAARKEARQINLYTLIAIILAFSSLLISIFK